MPNFEIKTQSGQIIRLTAKSYLMARTDAHRQLKPGDRIDGITTVKTEKALPSPSFEVIKTVLLGNEIIVERMNEVEASYIRYWTARREFWMDKTEADINEMFPNRYNSRAYYRSEYYQLRNENALTNQPYYHNLWLDRVKKDAAQAKEKSIWNMINAILKIVYGQPVTFFQVNNIRKGKAGLEGSIIVNNKGARLFAIYAEGPIQRLHIRYLIKGVYEIKESKPAAEIASAQAARIKALKG